MHLQFLCCIILTPRAQEQPPDEHITGPPAMKAARAPLSYIEDPLHSTNLFKVIRRFTYILNPGKRRLLQYGRLKIRLMQHLRTKGKSVNAMPTTGYVVASLEELPELLKIVSPFPDPMVHNGIHYHLVVELSHSSE